MRILTLVLILAITGACGGSDDRPVTDTSRVIYEEDINARDTTTALPPSRVGTLDLFGSIPQGGLCDVREYSGLTEVARQITYQTSAPRRTIHVQIGRPPRTFEPLSLQIIGTRSRSGLEEQETVFVGFSASGEVTAGSRQYTATGSESVNERQPLGPNDYDLARRYAQQVLGLCPTARRP